MADLAQVAEIQGGLSVAMPAGMAPEAQAVWQRLLDAGVAMQPTERDTLRAYVEAVARYEQASALLAGSGPLVRSGRGMAVNPLHQVARDDAQLIRSLARELDLDGRARQRWEFPF